MRVIGRSGIFKIIHADDNYLILFGEENNDILWLQNKNSLTLK